MMVQKKPAAGGNRFSSKGEKAEDTSRQNSHNPDRPQAVRLGVSRRLIRRRSWPQRCWMRSKRALSELTTPRNQEIKS